MAWDARPMPHNEVYKAGKGINTCHNALKIMQLLTKTKVRILAFAQKLIFKNRVACLNLFLRNIIATPVNLCIIKVLPKTGKGCIKLNLECTKLAIS